MSKKELPGTIQKKQKCFWSLVFCMKKWTKKPPNFEIYEFQTIFVCFRNKRSTVITCGWRAMHREITAMPWSQIAWWAYMYWNTELRSLFHVYICAICYKSLFEISGAKKILIVAAFFPIALSACQPSAQPSVCLWLSFFFWYV